MPRSRRSIQLPRPGQQEHSKTRLHSLTSSCTVFDPVTIISPASITSSAIFELRFCDNVLRAAKHQRQRRRRIGQFFARYLICRLGAPDPHVSFIARPQTVHRRDQLFRRMRRFADDLPQFGEAGLRSIGDREVERSRRRSRRNRVLQTTAINSIRSLLPAAPSVPPFPRASASLRER